ncbi:tRNA-uridine aminocarboxypropyltransferase [Rubripirellula reticaptiva]|uniref:tRNA-uridine aminocarboxypropyltransferase n=1 Tax=Rubripirellula reticaptiva TaxID=2528013 RepID=A0A5C6EVV3_9BACT|nr:tRNA-uridine aminocarboxypropyltransferase [Rubripirellula reticaptiva]TWU51796.1 DTW domain protein [Rubripirellula reticaptiva]
MRESQDTETAVPYAIRCVRCFRPMDRCYCDSVPSVDNQTNVLILQHRREREHPFNTARIVNMALKRCRLIVNHTPELARQFAETKLDANTVVLYPGDDVPLIGDFDLADRPTQLVVLDGTWHHTKTLMRDVPGLSSLPRVRLAPPQPGQYRIRREPNDHALSTLEAVVAALQQNEPESATVREQLDQLMATFHAMVDQQLKCPKSNWRANTRRTVGAPNTPRALLGSQENIVVVYGEQEQGDYRSTDDQPRPKHPAKPVYWMAQRMSSGETFEMAIENDCLNDSYFANRLQLSASQIQSAVSADEFRKQWQLFLRPSDILVVHHAGLAKLISVNKLCDHTCLILKAINAPDPESSTSVAPINETRAAERLANAIRLTLALSQQPTGKS